MVLNQLLAVLLAHAIEAIVGACQFTLETSQSGGNLLLNCSSLLRGVQTRTEWETVKVSSDSNPRGANHGSFISWERRALELVGRRLRLVHVVTSVAVIHLDDGVEESGELGVTIVATSVDTDARVNVLAAREDSISEREPVLITLILQEVPDITS